ncbi:hypothetical protein COY95_04025 [Candidatus Woesearchaeota archaeon CG_4_10_14_0_8_um_filter_47_5]|nr:MAG: hypothetical protein COY95_04025 [Candidatus Woesearchaeota archaeon CG_4_10_14_0_8_um_filter_47_5]
MLESVLSFFLRNWVIILFYLGVIALIYLNRKKFEFQGKIIALYRTKVGIAFMERLSKKSPEFFKLVGYIGIGLGFLGMFVITFLLVANIPRIITSTQPVEGVTPVLPGVRIPWSSFYLPLLEGIIAIFIVASVHEFSHGLIAKAHNLKIKSTGIMFLGPIFGAFVEPDEKELEKQPDVVQYSVFVAGPLSNVILALVVVLVMGYALMPLLTAMSVPVGFSLSEVIPDQPAYLGGVRPDVVFTEFNGNRTETGMAFFDALQKITPNQELMLKDREGNVYHFTAGVNPDDPERGYFGIRLSDSLGRPAIKDEREVKSTILPYNLFYQFIMFLHSFFYIVQLLSLGIGLANLMPIGPFDGGRMIKVSLQKLFGTKRGDTYWKQVSFVVLFVLAVNLFIPMIRWIIEQIPF